MSYQLCNNLLIIISLCVGILLGLCSTLNIRTVYFCINKPISQGLFEWALSSPPKPHAFVSLPLQSNIFNPNPYFKYLKDLFFKIVINIIKYVVFIFPFVIIFRTTYHCWYYDVWTLAFFTEQLVSNIPFIGESLINSLWGNKYPLTFDDLENHKYIIENLFTGGLGGSLGRTLYDTFSTDFFKQPAGIGVDNHPEVKIKGSTLLMDKDSDSDCRTVQGLSWKYPPKFHPTSGDPKVVLAEINAENLRIIIYSARDATYVYNLGCQEKIKLMEKWINTPMGIMTPDIIESFGGVFRVGSQLTRTGLQERMMWMNHMNSAMKFLSEDDSKAIKKIHDLVLDNIDKHLDKIVELTAKLGEKEDVLAFYNELFEETNAFRNKNTSIVNKAEKIFQSSFNRSPYSKSPIFKELINKDYIEGKQKFNKQEQYLKTKVSEVLRETKKYTK